jgi:hypothetical protein
MLSTDFSQSLDPIHYIQSMQATYLLSHGVARFGVLVDMKWRAAQQAFSFYGADRIKRCHAVAVG